jgi:DNA-binding transcriptional LysR family regulator
MNNIHHLELFYYVARYGGIGRAIPQIPYGIQQPAVSMQLRVLEDELGQTLFQRRPFRLTTAGKEVYDYVRPFFENLTPFMDKLRGASLTLVRVAAAPLVLRDYMPQILGRVRRRFPTIRFVLKEGPQAQVEEWFELQQIDLAVMQISAERPEGCRVQPLLKLPIVLLVNERSDIRSAEDLWKSGRFGETENLIGPWPAEVQDAAFEVGGPLVKIDPNRNSALEVNSIELIEHYVRHGHGVGLSIAVPGKQCPAGLRVVPFPGNPCVELGALWRGPLHAAGEALLGELQQQARLLRCQRAA